MSKLFENDYGVFISHKTYVDSLYQNVNGKGLQLNPNLFKISKQYNSNRNVKSKIDHVNDKWDSLQKEQQEIKSRFNSFMDEFMQKNVLNFQESENKDALEAAELVYRESGKSLVNNAFGGNIGPETMKTIDNSIFVFPANSIFFSKDISEIEMYLHEKKYDLILLDPPWWNKYIRRKRKKCGNAYGMLYNDDFKNIPIDKLLKDSGIVVVWCTNSPHHLNNLVTEIFPKWKVEFGGKWYWIKITSMGKPICNFSLPPGKQPFEQIIFGFRRNFAPSPFNSKLVVSVPSAIHSHKPPLVELLKPFLSEDPSCLEIFARYLLPGWTSFGNEVLRLQHESLFIAV
ncbi:hypothetical protein NQ314_018423 [Rhamnusium bicolor]|uniref:Methyltransferase-like protein 4 n=1 Tax=Rhamnusium bicolor TaxID=1586634 RepID=A0AAV8WR10_9CUCU|nr:hypothetical protein NQ314_018423 [Rhamnusium bicolor]